MFRVAEIGAKKV